ncbi:MAG: DUF5683 domain-containing protein [Aureispira sp.]
MAKTVSFSPWRYFTTVLFLTLSTISYAQNTTSTSTPESPQDSSFLPTENASQNANLVRERLAGERALKKEARRQRFLDRLPKNHNPRTATLLALIPGAGQIYNRRYWKLPIVWGGIGTLSYFMVKSKIEFECHKRTYLEQVDEFESTNYMCSISDTSLSDANLKIVRDNARSDSEMFIIGFTLFYGLTIIDAFVDAHLIRFDIDDDLSLQIKPSLQYDPLSQQVTTGVGLAIQPKAPSPIHYPVQF